MVLRYLATEIRGKNLPGQGVGRGHVVRVVTLLGVVTLFGIGCRRAETKPPPPPPAEVFVALPVSQDVTEHEEFTGQLQSPETVEVRSRVSGYLQKVPFKDGDPVKAGELLFEIDPRPYQAEVDRSAGALLQLEAREKRLQRQEDRNRALLERGSITQEAFDLIKYDHEEAIAAAKAAKGTKDLAELNLGFTKITARISGRISRRHVDPGNLVKADETPLTTIVSLDPLYAYFDIDERTILRLQRLREEGKIVGGLEQVPIQIALADEVNKFPLSGYIDFIDNQVETSTGTLRARAVVKNPGKRLTPGMFVRLRMPIGASRKALLVREESLGTDQGQRYVFVVDGKNEVEYRRVKVGWLTNGLRVIEEGINPQDRVIVTGLQRVRAKAKVNPKEAKSEVKVGSNPKDDKPDATVKPNATVAKAPTGS